MPKLGRVWSIRLGFELERYLKRIWHSISGLQGTPDTPTTIEAGTAAAAGSSQTPAPDDHQHDVDETGDIQDIALTGGAGSGQCQWIKGDPKSHDRCKCTGSLGKRFQA